MQDFQIKSVFGAFIGVFLFLYNSITEIIVILALLMMADYITGIIIAFKNGCFHPSEGIWGAIKKSMYSIVIMCGFLADFIFNYLSKSIQVPVTSPGMIGLAVTLYLIANEGLSIFRNLVKIGIPVPDFLMKIFGYIKDESGNIIKLPDNQCKTKRGGKRYDKGLS